MSMPTSEPISAFPSSAQPIPEGPFPSEVTRQLTEPFDFDRHDLVHPGPFPSEVTRVFDASIELLETDGTPLETEWHRYGMIILIDSVRQHFRGRTDFVAGGNMFIYYNVDQARNRDYKGPDFFFVWGRPSEPMRRYWAVWEEAFHFPNVIVELMSPSTRHVDLGTKKTLYQNTFRTQDYFCYDPLTSDFFGWTLTPDGYVELQPNERGWLWSDQLQLWLGRLLCVVANRKEVFLRFHTAEGKLVETFEGAATQDADRAKQRAKRAQVNAKQAKADAKKAQTDAKRAQSNADQERRRAEAAEAELARLKAILHDKDQPSS